MSWDRHGCLCDRSGSLTNLQAKWPYYILDIFTFRHCHDSLKKIKMLTWFFLLFGYVFARTSSSRTTKDRRNFNQCCLDGWRKWSDSPLLRMNCSCLIFRPFNRIPILKQRATMACRPQAMGTAVQMFQRWQELSRCIKKNHKDWDE